MEVGRCDGVFLLCQHHLYCLGVCLVGPMPPTGLIAVAGLSPLHPPRTMPLITPNPPHRPICLNTYIHVYISA